MFEEEAVYVYEIVAEARAVEEELVRRADRALTQLELEQRHRCVCTRVNISYHHIILNQASRLRG